MLTTIEKNESNQKNGDLYRIKELDDFEKKKLEIMQELFEERNKKLESGRKEMEKLHYKNANKTIIGILIACIIVILYILFVGV